jgi:hypothetical protein
VSVQVLWAALTTSFLPELLSKIAVEPCARAASARRREIVSETEGQSATTNFTIDERSALSSDHSATFCDGGSMKRQLRRVC